MTKTSQSQKHPPSKPRGILYIAIYEGLIGIIYIMTGFIFVSGLLVEIEDNPTNEDVISFFTIYGPLFLLYGIIALLCALFLLMTKEWARKGSMAVTACSAIFLFPFGIIPAYLSVRYLNKDEIADAYDKDYIHLPPRRRYS